MTKIVRWKLSRACCVKSQPDIFPDSLYTNRAGLQVMIFVMITSIWEGINLQLSIRPLDNQAVVRNDKSIDRHTCTQKYINLKGLPCKNAHLN